MPFRSKAQRRKFAELLVNGEITEEAYERWNKETGGAELPERVTGARGAKKATGARKATGTKRAKMTKRSVSKRGSAGKRKTAVKPTASTKRK